MRNKNDWAYGIAAGSVLLALFLMFIWIIGGDLRLWEVPDYWGPFWPVFSFIVVPLLVFFLIFLAKLANRGNKLFVAIEEVNLPLMQKMLKKNFALANKKDGRGCPALHYAIYMAGEKRTATADLLIKMNADVNVYDNAGATPLHIAARKGNLALVKLLVENGADPAIGMSKSHHSPGETPLLAAQKAGHKAVVEYLLSHQNISVNSQGK